MRKEIITPTVVKSKRKVAVCSLFTSSEPISFPKPEKIPTIERKFAVRKLDQPRPLRSEEEIPTPETTPDHGTYPIYKDQWSLMILGRLFHLAPKIDIHDILISYVDEDEYYFESNFDLDDSPPPRASPRKRKEREYRDIEDDYEDEDMTDLFLSDKPAPTISIGTRWSEEEINRLPKIVQMKKAGASWAEIGTQFPGRTSEAVRRKWTKLLAKQKRLQST